ncbi:NADP-dependent oxidoreductase [Promicromonospora thailandica]|uniref:NADPH:quinone reductase n=1 Tax=Promicromonospora thailandica TaxID=765201 RepID=A0A9X2JZ75_9MICO|nr:NADP-dependent oxidoreductase [Promicromonospora thailandica]MCP2265804.1 NADPH:quinone reductase [Promicromonospora thailandica]BFF21832.1 NADP-dependent oxidoreductase [Promicromonospora thailandica]
MKAITVTDPDAGTAGMRLTDRPEPTPAENDVVVRVHASGFTPGELTWPATWTDRAGRDRTPSIPGHELAGVVTELGYGTTGLGVGQRVFGLADWTRDGTLAEYVAVEARNLAPLPADIDVVTAASLPISGLTAWQGLFEHGRLEAGQSVLVHGAAGGVGSVVTQLAREAGAHVVGTGRTADRAAALDLGAHEFVDLGADELGAVGPVDLVLDVIGGEIGDRSIDLVRPGGTFVTVAEPPARQPERGRAVFFVVEVSRPQLTELARRVREGRLRTRVAAVHPLTEAVEAFNPTGRVAGKTIIRVTPQEG